MAADDSFLVVQSRSGTESVDRPSARQPQLQPFLSDNPSEIFELPPLPVAPPSPVTGALLQISTFVFEGNTVIPNEELHHAAAPYAERAVSASELEDLRHKLTSLYVDRGYINSGAVIPETVLRDGVLRIQIVEGRLDEVRLCELSF